MKFIPVLLAFFILSASAPYTGALESMDPYGHAMAPGSKRVYSLMDRGRPLSAGFGSLTPSYYIIFNFLGTFNNQCHNFSSQSHPVPFNSDGADIFQTSGLCGRVPLKTFSPHLFRSHNPKAGDPLLDIKKFEKVFQIQYIHGLLNVYTITPASEKPSVHSLPMAGMNLKMGLMYDHIKANLKSTSISVSSDTLYEIKGEISWEPVPFVYFYGGYKAFALNINDNNLDLDYNGSGPYLFFELRF